MAEAADGGSSDSDGKPQQMLARNRKEQNGAPKRSGWFPLGYKEGFSQWWANVSPATAEHNVLSFIPHLQKPPTQTQTGNTAPSSPMSDPNANDDLTKTTSQSADTSSSDPYGPRRMQSSLIKLSGKNRAINEFSVERIGEDVENKLVILHGWGAGLGFFYKNFEPLSRTPNWRLYALDLLGMGRSSRPPFRIHAKDRQGKVTEAENFFIDALEEWRIERKIERFTLLGHSLGGYMAVAYALKYPGRVNKLILASPVGIPEDPYAEEAPMPDEPGGAAVENEVLQEEADNVPQGTKDSNNFMNKRADNAAAGKSTSTSTTEPPRRRPYSKWLTYLWDANVSPFSFVRWSGPLGPRLVSGWTTRRFGSLPTAEAEALHAYSYSVFKQRGSGEYALAYVLAPGAFARSPLIRRIAAVGRGEYRSSDVAVQQSAADSKTSSTTASDSSNAMKTLKEHGIPIIFMYGANDWMDVKGGHAAVEKLQERKKAVTRGLSTEEARKDQSESKVLIVKNAGHHLYLDGWEEFNGMVEREMKDTEKREREWRMWWQRE